MIRIKMAQGYLEKDKGKFSLQSERLPGDFWLPEQM